MAEIEIVAKSQKRMVQDDSRQKQIAKLCGLVLTNSRGGVDAVDGDGNLFEIKSTTTASVSTARDAGLHTIAKWRKRYWVIASGESLNKGYVIANLYIAHPDDLEPFFQKTEQKLKGLNQVCVRVMKAAKKAGAEQSDIAVVQDILERRGVTLNNPSIPLKLVGERATQLDPSRSESIIKSIRSFAKKRPIVVAGL